MSQIMKDTSTGIEWELPDDPVILVSNDHSVNDEMRAHIMRWSEIRLYEGNDCELVLVQIGRTRVPGEHDYIRICRCEDIDGVADALARTNAQGRQYFTHIARSLLTRAAVLYGSPRIRI